MPVNRSRLRRNGPPSQKLAIAGIWAGHVGVGTSVLASILGNDHTLQLVALLVAFALYAAAFVVERRERRREAAEQEHDDNATEAPAVGAGVLWVIAGLLALMAVALVVAAAKDHAGPGAAIVAAVVFAGAALIVRAARKHDA